MGIEENIVPGKILFLWVRFPHEHEFHNKYFVVVGLTETPLLLKINSNRQRSDEFPIEQSTYPFLRYDSFLDCGKVWYTLISREEIIRQLTRDETRIKGELIDGHKIQVMRRVGASRTIAPRHKEVIVYAMKVESPT
jgi:hypothetical protein